MNKNELTLQMKKQSVKVLDLWIGFAKHAISALGVVVSVWLIFRGLEPILAGKDADSISAFAKVVDALKMGSILGYVWGAGATGLYVLERGAKKRAIRRKSALQKQLEQGEPNRTSCQLTETGNTPQ